MLSIDDTEAAAKDAPSSGNGPESILQLFERLRNSVPPDAWADLPTDFGQEQKTLPLRISKGDDGLMRTLFADAGYWIALLYSGDQLHERATTVAAGLEPVAIVTTQMALAEALNHLQAEASGFDALPRRWSENWKPGRTCKSSLRQTGLGLL